MLNRVNKIMKLSKSEEELPLAVGKGLAGEFWHILLALVVMVTLVVVVFVFDVPNPNMLLITGLAVFTSLYGYGAGLTCAAVMVVYSMYFFSTDHSFFSFTTVNLQKMSVIVLGVLLNTLFIGNLKRKQTEANRKLEQMNRLLQDENRSLEAVSLTDALTGTRNRYALRRDYTRFEGCYLHVMMLDLDDFKHVNDAHGHAIGDEVLKRVGRVLTDCFDEDSCYRFGGDEFLVILEGLEESAFLARMNDVKDSLKAVRLNGVTRPIHFSAGYVHGECEMGFDLRLMMHQADRMLYEAKGMGKDCYAGQAFDRSVIGPEVRKRMDREWGADGPAI